MRRLRSQSGFTLIELVIAMPMLLILLAGLSTTLIQLMHSNDQTQSETTLQTEARAIMNTMVSDIRQAFVGDGSTDPIITATANSLTIDTPDRYPTVVNGVNENSFHLRQVTYTVTNGTLSKQVTTSTNTYPTAPPWTWPGTAGPTYNVMSGITSSNVFTYYTENDLQVTGTPESFPISDTTGLRAVGIKLAVSTGGTSPKIFTFNETVALRETDDT
ncbi:MAG TPA: prepilin-type N-terminal cleavage/methylation domain-containing protein [Gaiellaceae bacterium]|nr:prepilin-type N-terminal cleavage/methylation domain-containing protein [Gaiellaceae bacterium]